MYACGQQQVKIDRVAMRDVVERHAWKFPIKWLVFNSLVNSTDNAEEYRSVLQRSSFTLCPVGTGDDNFRFWEAIEAGSIPIVVPRNESLMHDSHVIEQRGERDCPDSFNDILRTNPPIVLLQSWDDLPNFLDLVTEEQIGEHRENLFRWNHEFWSNTTQAIDSAIRAGIRKLQ